MLPSPHQSAGQNRDMNTAKTTFEKVGEFLVTTVTNQNLIREKIKRLNSSLRNLATIALRVPFLGCRNL
jgi:hypothetical protein